MFCGGVQIREGGPNPLADMDRGGPNPPADLGRGGSKSSVTPAQRLMYSPCFRIIVSSA